MPAQKGHLRRLMRHIEQLSKAVAKLPPLSKGKLNRIIIEQNWTEFDSEAFGQNLPEAARYRLRAFT
jgi:hypothetical protein